MRHTDDHFAKRPNWILRHPVMRGNPYNQAVYTHLRGLNPYTRWRSVRQLCAHIAEETGFTESSCRKAMTALSSAGFVLLQDDGVLKFGEQSDCGVATQVAKVDTPVAKMATQVATLPPVSRDDARIDNREIDRDSSSGTSVPLLLLKIVGENSVHKVKGRKNMILGADPHATATAPPPSSREVLRIFNTEARRVGANPVKSQDEIIKFSSLAKRALQSGHSQKSLTEMILTFFQFDRNREHPCPWRVFFSTEVFNKLQTDVVGITISDPLLNWIYSDFSHSPELPWDADFNETFQTLVYRRGVSLTYRYADLTAEVARTAHGDVQLAETLITAAAQVLHEYLSGNDAEHHLAILKSHGVLLPKDFSKTRVRKEASTMQEAVLIAFRKTTKGTTK